MKSTLLALALLVVGAICANAQGYHYRNGYVNKNGTYVPGHYATNPNGTRLDNWSTKGNHNPFTGQPGYKSPYGGQNSGGYTGGYTGSSGYRFRAR